MNVLWIVVDCLRADRLSGFGDAGGGVPTARRTSPHLDHFARGCVRFDQCISPHIPTHPAHTTLFSGRDVFSHQIVAQGGRQELAPTVRLLPDLLRERGYFTGAVDNIGRWIEPAFERYESYPRWDHDGSRPWRNGEEVNARALPLLDAAARDGRPFFLFLHYWDPHTPYLPPAPFHRMFYERDERDPGHTSMAPVWRSPWFANYFAEWIDGVTDRSYVIAEYDASVAYVDACLSHVFAKLSALDLDRDTLVIVMADHGEELDDHGCWFDHHGLYDTNVRVPLLLRYPDSRGAGRSYPGLVSALDLAPTVLDVLGLADLAVENGMSGRTLALAAEGDPTPPLDAVYLTECTWMRKRGWRTPEWKLIRALEPDLYGKPPIELYDLRTDPGEQRNVVDERPDVVASLTAAMETWIATRMATTGLPDPIVAQAEALRIWQPRFVAGRRAAGSPAQGQQ